MSSVGMQTCATKRLRLWQLDRDHVLRPVELQYVNADPVQIEIYICQSQLVIDAEIPSARLSGAR